MTRPAWLATVLLLCDGVYLVQSRIAMTNIFAVLFQVSAALFILRAALAPRLSAPDMLAGGVCLGLALSTRWTSLWAAGFLGLVLLAVRRLRLVKPRELALKSHADRIALCGAAGARIGRRCAGVGGRWSRIGLIAARIVRK